MTMVLLNDINDSRMPYLFIVHIHALMELQWSSRIKNQLISFIHETKDQEKCSSSSSVWKKKMKEDVQMLEHSSQNEDMAM